MAWHRRPCWKHPACAADSSEGGGWSPSCSPPTLVSAPTIHQSIVAWVECRVSTTSGTKRDGSDAMLKESPRTNSLDGIHTSEAEPPPHWRERTIALYVVVARVRITKYRAFGAAILSQDFVKTCPHGLADLADVRTRRAVDKLPGNELWHLLNSPHGHGRPLA